MSDITTYQQEHLDQKANYPELDTLNSTSKVSIWRLWVFIVSFVANTLRKLHDVHQEEMLFLIDAQKITSLNYYRTTVLNFRKGHAFDREALVFTDTYTDAEILTAQIVKRAAVQAVSIEGRRKLFLKLASEDTNGILTKIADADMVLIQDYMQPNIGAGTHIEYFSDNADQLRMEVDVYIDPQILSVTGERIDGTDNIPVPTAIQNFLKDKNFKFDGELVLSLLADTIQEVQGVIDRSVSFVKVESNFKTPESWEVMNERYTANSGYFELLDANLTINYIIK